MKFVYQVTIAVAALCLFAASYVGIVGFFGGMAEAQYANSPINSSTTAPSGPCTANTGRLIGPQGVLYTCQSGTWAIVSGGGGGDSTICIATASATAPTCPGVPVPTSLTGLTGTLVIQTTTSGAPTTLNIAGLGAKNIYINGIVSGVSNVLVAGSYQFYYDGTQIQVQRNCTAAGSAGTVQVAGSTAGSCAGDPLVANVALTGGAYFSATADANGGAPNECPTWLCGSLIPFSVAGLFNLNLSEAFDDSDTPEVLAIYGNISNTGMNSTYAYGSEVELRIPVTSTGNFYDIYGSYIGITKDDSGTTDVLDGEFISMVLRGTGTVTAANAIDVYMANNVGSIAGSVTGLNIYIDFTATPATDIFAIYISGTIAGSATNPYYEWFDSRGVRRVKEDATFNAVGQAIEALYNPQFTKYTPGTPNYERVILGEWNGNVAEIGDYAGGTGTVRDLRLMGPTIHVGSASNIANTTFAGAGVNDGVFNGTYTGSTHTYCAVIDATGTPDTFSWGTNGACDDGATGVAVTGANQALSSGAVIKFATTTGHTLADKWSVVATAAADYGSLSASALSFDALKTTGSATGKKVVCVDTATGIMYASSTGTDCSN